VARCGARWLDGGPAARADWDEQLALERAARVAREFEAPQLALFDSHLFWGSWKWIGWFATEFTWTGRWIMHSVVRRDVRAVALCVAWLRHGTYLPKQSEALRDALNQLTGQSFSTDEDWVRWYDGDANGPGAKVTYPEPDIDAWLRDLKAGTAGDAG